MVGTEPHRAAQPSLRLGRGAERLHGPPPAEIMVKILGGDTVEWAQPRLEAPMVPVDIVDVEMWGLGTRAAGGGQDVARDFGIASEADDGFAAIATQIVGRGDDTSKSSRDRCAVELPRQ